MQQQTCETVNL